MNAAIFARDSTTNPMSGRLPLFEKPQYVGIEWDAENRLLAINQGTLRSEFTYDGIWRRVKIVEKNNGVVTSDRRFLWCASAICEERNSGGGTVVKRYFAGGVQQSAQPHFYSRDHLGSIRELSDGATAIKARYDYDPYGKRSVVSEDLAADLGFTGHYEHSFSGTTLTLYRAYSASIGRWLSEDIIGMGDGPNRYVYAHSNVINLIDLDGLQTSVWGEMCKPVCREPLPPVPPLPPGEDIKKNINECRTHSDPRWFYNQVKNKGPWDYKQKGPQYQAAGNFNFGATCVSFGFSETTCLREAGRGQQAAGTSQPGWGDPGSRWDPWGGTPPYGDDPVNDVPPIKKGFEYFKKYRDKALCGCQ